MGVLGDMDLGLVVAFDIHGIGLLCYLHFPSLLKMCVESKHTKAQILHSMNIHDPKQSTHLVAGNGMGTSAVSLLCNRKLDTLTLGQRNPWLLRSNDENVVLTGSERVVYGILDVDDVEASIVTLTVSDDTNTTHVTTTSDHSDHTSIELDEV